MMLRETEHLSIENHGDKNLYYIFEGGWVYDIRHSIEEANKLFDYLLNTRYPEEKVKQITLLQILETKVEVN